MLIVGPPATAKTAMAYHFAAFNDFDTITTTGATKQPVDVGGQPALTKADDGSTIAEHLPYGDLRQAMSATKPTLWILDDFTNSDKDVQKAFMQLLHERRVNDHVISDHVHIIATGNRREDKSGVSALIEAVKTRFGMVIEIVPDLDQFVTYGIQNNMHGDVLSFLRFMPDKLYISNPTNDMNREPNLRMWKFLSDALHELDDMQADAQTRNLAIKDTCGAALGNDVIAHIDLKADLPDPETCLEDPETCALPNPDNISAVFAFNLALARLTTVTNIHRIITIADRLPKIAGAKLVFDAASYCPEIEDTSAYLKWSGRNKINFLDN